MSRGRIVLMCFQGCCQYSADHGAVHRPFFILHRLVSSDMRYARKVKYASS